jgi:hypothetical protein
LKVFFCQALLIGELNNVQTSDPEVSISDLIKEQELLDEEFGCVHDEGC